MMKVGFMLRSDWFMIFMDRRRTCFGVMAGMGSEPGLFCSQVSEDHHRPKGRQGEGGDALGHGEIHIGG